MKVSIKITLTILIGTLGLSTALKGEELLTNPSFEDEISNYDKQGWDARGPQAISLERVKDPVKEGDYALLVDGRSGPKWEGVKQAVKLEMGKTYRISGSIRLGKGEKADKGAVQLIKSYGPGKTEFQDIFRSKLNASEYTTFTETFSIEGKQPEELFISIHGMGGGKSFIIDGFSLQEID
ncbi:hypothetical protein G0Q06_05365 [Puniceicoccales bacterium CK1056]|uniref:CBM-cenC domain-containing protein n=1 Tax=Oceanipulchritudo coccoides TaxID=2706888 RepID=A0A6B2M0F8_9BACT|nr:carbohydrate binding domain-containing protein [Oceanipulchritudo coccoides]NDV61872.1 hypothetical protein [Oceanipulchritudo coccoides]